MANTYAIRNVANLTFINLTTGIPFFKLKAAQTTTVENTAESVFARGGDGNPKLARFDGNREATLKVSTQIIDFNLISLLAGSDITTGANVFKREVLTAAAGAIALSATPVEGSVTVFALADDLVPESKKTIVVTGSSVAISGTPTSGSFVAYYYTVGSVSNQTITVNATKFPKACKLIGDTLIKRVEDDVMLPYQLQFNKAHPQAAFTLNFAATGEPTTFEMTFDLYADENGDMYSQTIINA